MMWTVNSNYKGWLKLLIGSLRKNKNKIICKIKLKVLLKKLKNNILVEFTKCGNKKLFPGEGGKHDMQPLLALLFRAFIYYYLLIASPFYQPFLSLTSSLSLGSSTLSLSLLASWVLKKPSRGHGHGILTISSLSYWYLCLCSSVVFLPSAISSLFV